MPLSYLHDYLPPINTDGSKHSQIHVDLFILNRWISSNTSILNNYSVCYIPNSIIMDWKHTQVSLCLVLPHCSPMVDLSRFQCTWRCLQIARPFWSRRRYVFLCHIHQPSFRAIRLLEYMMLKQKIEIRKLFTPPRWRMFCVRRVSAWVPSFSFVGEKEMEQKREEQKNKSIQQWMWSTLSIITMTLRCLLYKFYTSIMADTEDTFAHTYRSIIL